VGVFLVAIWGAYLIRSLNQWTLGMLSFWTTRVGAAFDAWYLSEMLLSGRIVPLALMPGWARSVSAFLPFKWTFAFPIEALVGRLSTADLLGGLAMQALWIAVGALAVKVVWRRGVRRFTAVGG
jgi:ABC-2 type transport system permease protein